MQSVYLDHAATTPPDPEVLEAMDPFLKNHYGNAHSPHQFGRKANGAVESARQTIADTIGCDASEIIFTSGGTESNNAIIKGVAQAVEGSEIITSEAEHHAVLDTVDFCRNLGMKPVYLSPQEDGRILPEQVEEAITSETVLVSIMHVNNELGSLNDLKAIGDICNNHDVLFHTDAVQGLGKQQIDVDELELDFLSASGHKIHAPKGIGFMYIRNKSNWKSWMHGGSQENNRRAGTLNVPGIVALSEAVKKSQDKLDETQKHLHQLRQVFVDGLQERLGDQYKINGPQNSDSGVPHILNISFFDDQDNPIDAEMLLMNLDMEGVCASSGSACASGAVEPSHVLQSIGLSRQEAQSAVRFSMGKDNTIEEIEYTVDAIERVLDRLG